jgi:hypothetical protein
MKFPNRFILIKQILFYLIIFFLNRLKNIQLIKRMIFLIYMGYLKIQTQKNMLLFLNMQMVEVLMIG